MTSDINRSNYDPYWLVGYSPYPEPPGRFKKLMLEEKANSRDSIKKALSDAILHHHMEPDEIKYCIDELGYSSLAERLPQKTLVTKKGKIKKNTVRIGSFGEVIAAEHLCQYHGYKMPVYKLRHTINPKIALPGEDIIGFKITEDEKINTICLGEVKTLKSFASANVKEAHERLDKSYTEPVTFYFISRELFKKGEADLAKQVIQIVGKMGLKNFPTENWIFIITGNKPRNPFKPISEMSSVVNDLNVVSLHLQDLHDFIDETFELTSKSP